MSAEFKKNRIIPAATSREIRLAELQAAAWTMDRVYEKLGVPQKDRETIRANLEVGRHPERGSGNPHRPGNRLAERQAARVIETANELRNTTFFGRRIT